MPRKPVPASFISLDAPPVKAICYTATPKYQWDGTVKIEEYKKDVTDPDIVKAALAELALKDENDKALEKKTKESKKLKRVKRDDEDDDLEDDK